MTGVGARTDAIRALCEGQEVGVGIWKLFVGVPSFEKADCHVFLYLLLERKHVHLKQMK